MLPRKDVIEVGKVRASPLERFGRNQRRAHLVAPSASGQCKGVVRFASWEEVEKWQSNHQKTN